MWLEYDSEADAAYIWIREDMGRAFGLDLDSSRYVDFGADERSSNPAAPSSRQRLSQR